MSDIAKPNRGFIELKWQKIWNERKVFQARQDTGKQKYYVLEMFPYPSGSLHVGHVRNYVIGDVIARYKRLQGFEVLHPVGWDAFGLPAENAAIEKGVSPHDWTKSNINAMRTELLSLGLSYDWTREIATCDSSYYVHEQKLFLRMLNAGLAYRKESLVNWDPVDKTVLANEQVVNGKGWRSGAPVEQKTLKQWFFKITHYAERLLQDLDGWPSNVKLMQKNWIGKAEGLNIKFSVINSSETIVAFSTRPETLFGCTFLVISPHHPLVKKFLSQNTQITNFVTLCEKMSITHSNGEQEKLGINTGLYVQHPLNGAIKIPVFIANFVLADYASGAIFGCPAHDARDWEFAQKYSLPIVQVIKPLNGDEAIPYFDDGLLINSEFLNGLNVSEAKQVVIRHLTDSDQGSVSTQYKLKDWGVSRQRFWGCPIPIIYCPSCGMLPVPEDQLPIVLPKNISITGKGNPLELHSNWRKVICHKCGSDAERETDTFDTFFESSWYFLRFCSPETDDLVDKTACKYWMPVDYYIGGIEHAILHLMYARFLTKVISDLGYCDVSEPFSKLLNQGMVLHHVFTDKNGSYVVPSEVKVLGGKFIHKLTEDEVVQSSKLEKMSKSKKNIVSLKNMVEEYGADTVRLFAMSDSPPERDFEWNAAGIEGCSRFVDRLFTMAEHFLGANVDSDPASALIVFTQTTVVLVSEALENAKFNKAIALLRELYNAISENISTTSNLSSAFVSFKSLITMLNPFMPHVTEEIWQKLKESEILAERSWPVSDSVSKEKSSFTIPIQVNGKIRATIEVNSDLSEEEVKTKALNHAKIVSYIPKDNVQKVIYVPGRIINIISYS